ncbi:MAG: T9SS type A sorting domain-containing protein [Bacteroidota bacterium]
MKVKILSSTLSLLISIFFTSAVYSQAFPQMGCDNGNRYVNDIFTADSPASVVQFGQNTTVNGTDVDLMMDIYEPDGDGLSQRPVIVLAFGGSFIGGDRSTVEVYCREYARKGFVTVAIDYRIYDAPLVPLPDSLDMLEVVVGAVSDMKAAVRQLRFDADNGNPYRIDPDYIFIGGVSAGAIVGLHAAYFDANDVLPQYILDEINAQGGFEGNSNDATLAYSSETQGVVNYFGALNDADWLGMGDAPVSSLHGTEDEIVPYGVDFANVCLFGFCIPIISMEGSFVINQRANEVGVPSHFISVEGGGHGNFSAETYEEYRDATALFFHNEVLCGTLTSVEDVREDVSQFVVAYPNPASNAININFNGLNRQYDLRVFNNVGQLVFENPGLLQNEVSIPVQQLAAGMYQLVIEFESDDILPVRKKIAVVR